MFKTPEKVAEPTAAAAPPGAPERKKKAKAKTKITARAKTAPRKTLKMDEEGDKKQEESKPPVEQEETKKEEQETKTEKKKDPAKYAATAVAEMSGMGKRHRNFKFRDNIQGITKPAIRRLARRGGVKRISGDIYENTRIVLRAYLEPRIKRALLYTQHAGRKTCTLDDMLHGLKSCGDNLWGMTKQDQPRTFQHRSGPPMAKKPTPQPESPVVTAA